MRLQNLSLPQAVLQVPTGKGASLNKGFQDERRQSQEEGVNTHSRARKGFPRCQRRDLSMTAARPAESFSRAEETSRGDPELWHEIKG